MTVLQTARLELVPVSMADLPDMVAWHADPEMGGMLKHGVLGPAQTAALLREYVAGWRALGFGMWLLRERAGGEAVGLAGLWTHDAGEGIAMRGMLRPQFQGHGYMPEAMRPIIDYGFRHAGLARIVGISRADNRPARRAAEALGLRLVREFVNDSGVRLAVHAIEAADVVGGGM